MISFLSGTVHRIAADHLVVLTYGVGRKVHVTPDTLAGTRHGTEIELVTSLVVREDSMTLYGFADEDERNTFEILTTVSGIGPKIGLAVLSVHTPDILRSIVERKDIPGLTQVPGIGQKGAQRILLELGNKLGPATSQVEAVAPASASADVVAALVGLGWNEDVAARTVSDVEAEHGAMPVSQTLRVALQKLGGKR